MIRRFGDRRTTAAGSQAPVVTVSRTGFSAALSTALATAQVVP